MDRTSPQYEPSDVDIERANVRASAQIEKLSRFIAEEIPDEPSRGDEGAVDCAIRLLRDRFHLWEPPRCDPDWPGVEKKRSMPDAIDAALLELGEPSPDYPQPIANAVAILKAADRDETDRFQTIDFIMSEPPGPDSHFVEVESPPGNSIDLGKWIEHGCYHILRFRAILEG